MSPVPDLARELERILGLLRRTEPESREGDVTWRGPYFIPRRGDWWPSSFVLYRDELYCSLEIGWSSRTLVWRAGTDAVRFEGTSGLDALTWNEQELWRVALTQIERRLRDAVQHAPAYNRRVHRLLPLRCRVGHIARKWTWPRGDPTPLAPRELRILEEALRAGARARSWRKLTSARFLRVAGWCYDAAFPETAHLSNFEKHRKWADTRDGGMLRLPPDDGEAFERWFDSRDWQGAHPWEIVFAHPHGIMLSPLRERGAWRFTLGVDTLGLYVATARMSITLGARRIPFELFRADEVTAALRGEDLVEIGPFYGQLSLNELAERRPDASRRVAWDAPARITPAGGEDDRGRSRRGRHRRGEK